MKYQNNIKVKKKKKNKMPKKIKILNQCKQ